MTVNAEVIKGKGETTPSLIRRFTKKVQATGLVRHARKTRYSARNQSKYGRHKYAIKRIANWQALDKLRKLGKAPLGREKKKRG